MKQNKKENKNENKVTYVLPCSHFGCVKLTHALDYSQVFKLLHDPTSHDTSDNGLDERIAHVNYLQIVWQKKYESASINLLRLLFALTLRRFRAAYKYALFCTRRAIGPV